MSSLILLSDSSSNIIATTRLFKKIGRCDIFTLFLGSLSLLKFFPIFSSRNLLLFLIFTFFCFFLNSFLEYLLKLMICPSLFFSFFFFLWILVKGKCYKETYRPHHKHAILVSQTSLHI